jgi:hypothetical protein
MLRLDIVTLRPTCVSSVIKETDMNSLSVTLPLDDPKLPAVLAALGLATSAAPTAIPVAPQVGCSVDPSGLAILDDQGTAVVADPRNASAGFLAGLRLLASRPDVTERDLLTAVGATTLAGHKAATSKRVQRALGGKRGAVLFRVERGRAVLAPQTRQALARHFGIAP